ncbi:hypothetical protein AA906_00570 [Geobacillus stearothermophilus]|uniref:hypothetical protein n=1 Tax=Geobacillus stearothermophilus TaxID=1422 RepID=UPI00066FFB53|nr:hypothetical protein [Geobacillus stearothermophilus]KMY63160.1 hypothetical protein AA906_00570 [Geobacillus stearothermophilus]
MCKKMSLLFRNKVIIYKGEAVVLPVKLYQNTRKLFVYNRQMRLMNIPLDRLIFVEPTRIIGSFDRRGEEAMVHTR